MKNVRRLHDDEWYDEVLIGVVPRYNEHGCEVFFANRPGGKRP